ncbi:MAG: hypothetical protein CMH28_00230 [Micavibrio sp.]|nr:hypothetical protein [Micavibrio sp.]
MKLSYISGSTIPSSKANSVHVVKMCQALGRLPDMDIVLYGKQGKPADNPYAFYGVKENFKLVRSPLGSTQYLSGLSRLASLFFKIGLIPAPQVFYGRDIIGLYLLSFANEPVFYEAHQVPKGKIQRSLTRRLLKKKAFKGLVVISEGLKEDFLNSFPDYKGPVLVAHDGADVTERNPKGIPAKDWPGRKDAKQIGYTGSLHKGRGMEIIMSVARLLPEMDFHVVGGTSSDLKYWEGQNPPANLYMHGSRPHSQINAYLAKFDVVLAPYQETIKIGTGADISRWISPMKLFEYMAAGKAIIASDLPVLREILSHGRNATLVPPADTNRWVEAICHVGKSSALRHAMGLEGEKDIQDIYSWNKRAAKVREFIQTQTGVD